MRSFLLLERLPLILWNCREHRTLSFMAQKDMTETLWKGKWCDAFGVRNVPFRHLVRPSHRDMSSELSIPSHPPHALGPSRGPGPRLTEGEAHKALLQGPYLGNTLWKKTVFIILSTYPFYRPDGNERVPSLSESF